MGKEQCHTEHEEQCHDELVEECKTEYTEECQDEPEEKCHTETSQECTTEYDEVCSIDYADSCHPEWVEKCKEVPDCRTEWQEGCHVKEDAKPKFTKWKRHAVDEMETADVEEESLEGRQKRSLAAAAAVFGAGAVEATVVGAAAGAAIGGVVLPGAIGYGLGRKVGAGARKLVQNKSQLSAAPLPNSAIKSLSKNARRCQWRRATRCRTPSADQFLKKSATW